MKITVVPARLSVRITTEDTQTIFELTRRMVAEMRRYSKDTAETKHNSESRALVQRGMLEQKQSRSRSKKGHNGRLRLTAAGKAVLRSIDRYEKGK